MGRPETLDVEIKHWASGKEGNLRALLSTLQYSVAGGVDIPKRTFFVRALGHDFKYHLVRTWRKLFT
ncbi:auxilin-related protein 1 [Quercus suber]|uniref:Auxilin-related protein 1 n=1 Tax=Quercus suber TaxID=58331 RepID=A0AAW0LHS4_QUESU